MAGDRSSTFWLGAGENAKQGFYNGSPLPLGYKSVEAERRGDKIKKKIAIDQDREQDVRDIFRLYVDGDPATNTPPLGTAALAAWLNERGYRTAENMAFSVAAVGRILSNTAYIGKYLYNQTDSRTRERKDPSEIVVIPCPPIIDDETFEGARAKAQENHPKQLSSRSSSSPVLLSRLAICGHCGGWMQKSPGTGALGGKYSYYACSTRVKKGKSECPGVRIRMDYLDDEVIRFTSDHLCTQHRLTEMLSGLYHRLSASAAKTSASLAAAEKELNEWDERLRRLHRSIEEGVIPLDEVLRERVTEISTQRETAKKNVQRLQKQLIPPQVIDSDKIEFFSNAFKERLKNGNPVLRRNYLKSVIGAVIVEPTKIRIVGDKCQLAESVGAFSFAPKKVHTFAPKWRTMNGLNTIIVTGASSGIGAYCARALRAEGWRVFATARKPEDIAALEADGIEAFYLDYREPRSIAALVDAVLAKTGGRLDALFNNGAYSQQGAVEDISVDALREQFEANFFGWHDLTRRIVPVMRRQGHGRIINCSSIMGLAPFRFRGPYAASKHALEGLMLCMRSELAGTNIHVSLIEPGPVKSRIASNALHWFNKNVDRENSVHRDAYRVQLDRLKAGGSASALKPGPEVVYEALRHALLSRRPKPHYVVTWPARLGAAMKRFLPPAMFYRILAARP